MAAEVRIWLLGGFRVGIDSRPVPDDAWRRNKAKAAAARSLLEAAGSTYERLGATPGHQAIKDRLLTLA